MKLLLIEDDEILSKFIVKGLREAGFIVDHMPDGLGGLEALLQNSYDLAIVDLMLPKLDGLSVIEKIRGKKIKLPIIILSAKRSIDDRVNGLQKGSDDYLTKPFSFSELLARIEALLRRSNDINDLSELVFEDISLDLVSRSVVRDNKKIDLQPKEFALLEYLIRNAGRIVSKTMIIERVWSYDFDPGTNVVEARISKLREKIDKDFKKTLIHTVRGLGYTIKKDA